jgi:hypothetical protein
MDTSSAEERSTVPTVATVPRVVAEIREFRDVGEVATVPRVVEEIRDFVNPIRDIGLKLIISYV